MDQGVEKKNPPKSKEIRMKKSVLGYQASHPFTHFTNIHRLMVPLIKG